MQNRNWLANQLANHRLWLELFVLVNLLGMAPDILLAHSTNSFREWTEYIPLVFSLVAPVVLLYAEVQLELRSRATVWRWLGGLVGWSSIFVGGVGLLLHLDSRFFQERTLESLVYAAPFAAPLAYTGVGMLLVMNRMVDADSNEWPHWVLLMALVGFAGNFIFSLTDHAQNGFYHETEWIPVVSSALAVGFLTVPLIAPISRGFLKACAAVLLLQGAVGVLGFYFHLIADLDGIEPTLFGKLVYGAPVLAPLLFLDLVLLALLGLYVLSKRLPHAGPSHAATLSG